MLGLASLCEITNVDKEIIKKCLSFERKDFEDSVQYESALLHQVDVIVTRNVKDFRDFAENVQIEGTKRSVYLKESPKMVEEPRIEIVR